ncbi:hypothetical protein RclHR1_09640006 [Rhizophagus clarus]|uniref:Uncharacterized protein n=1 Tax=Rhizophagus clarus TaxID=94130 RepID=A0A2Z6SF52_9GLOM|nr:hypothetical protein RclHR1_09640006 [Rhizophagus clarus]GES90116.1 hypothetical protein GLOIN_2v1474674 [Rhizophagus clarus]
MSQTPKFVFVDTIQDPESLIHEIEELASKMDYSFTLPIEELIIPNNSSTPQNSFFIFKKDQMAKSAETMSLKTNYYKYKPLFELVYKLQVMYSKGAQSTFTNPPTFKTTPNEFGEAIDDFIDNDPEIKSML